MTKQNIRFLPLKIEGGENGEKERDERRILLKDKTRLRIRESEKVDERERTGEREKRTHTHKEMKMFGLKKFFIFSK